MADEQERDDNGRFAGGGGGGSQGGAKEKAGKPGANLTSAEHRENARKAYDRVREIGDKHSAAVMEIRAAKQRGDKEGEAKAKEKAEVHHRELSAAAKEGERHDRAADRAERSEKQMANWAKSRG
jgi:hypothetical protein